LVSPPLFWESLVLGSLGRLGEMREVNKRQIVNGEATHNPVAVAEAHRALGASSNADARRETGTPARKAVMSSVLSRVARPKLRKLAQLEVSSVKGHP
jgi:hypothetical protein